MTDQKFIFKSEQDVLDAAKNIVLKRLKLTTASESFTDPSHVSDYLVLNFKQQKYEQFGVLFLNSKHKLIKDEVLFNGGIHSAHIYPRVIVQRALELNSSCCVIYHSHPSGCPQPSQADRDLTVKLVKTLELIDVKILDHFVVSGNKTFSFASHQLI